MMKHRFLYGLAGALALGVVVTGCSSSPTPGASDSNSGGATDSVEGTTVTIYGTPIGGEATQLENSWADWAKENGITIKYTGDRAFTSNISTMIQGNSVPDIALFPQPGLLKAAIDTGKVLALDDATKATVEQNFSKDWQAYGTVDSTLYAVPLDASAKGYIWYSPKQFEQEGLSVPTSWDELMTLTGTLHDKIGGPVWCAGFASDDASGWPGTDQIAEYVLSASGGEVYDQWVAGDVTFTDPAIADAYTALGKILLNPDYVNAGFGDVASINSTGFADVAVPLASGECALTNQATFLKDSLATTKTADGATPTLAPDGDIWAFVMPPVAGKASIVGGGDFAVAFADRPEVRKVLNYLATGDYATSLISPEGATFITANQGVDVTKEADPLLAEAMKNLTDPDATFRFGAGDAMPAVVQQAFWRGTIDWVNGTDQATVLEQIQAAWADA